MARKARPGRLNFGWLLAGILLATLGAGAAWALRLDAEFEAQRSPDRNAVYAENPWPGRIVAGGEILAVLGVAVAAGGLLDLRLQQIRREIGLGVERPAAALQEHREEGL